MSDYAVINPATGETVAEYPTISDADLVSAIKLADETHRGWAHSTTVKERAELVRAIGALHAERREELAAIIVREMGKPTEQALGEIDFCQAIYEYYADNGEKFMADEAVELSWGEGSAVIHRGSVGVILGIMPWNFPYYQVARFGGPNLIIGNTVLLKHAPQCPESAAALQQLYIDAGVPAGAYVNIYASNDQIATVIADPRVQGVSVTGSERAGAAVAEIAGRNLKKVVLEMGGSDPFILLSTNDLDAVVESAAAARLDNAGQACNAAKRFVVAADLFDDFSSKLTEAFQAVEPGDPFAEGCAMGGRLARNGVRVLIDESVPQTDLEAIREALDESRPAGVISYHRLRARRSGATRHIDVHVVVDPGMTVSEAHRITDQIEASVEARLPSADVVVHVEPAGSKPEPDAMIGAD